MLAAAGLGLLVCEMGNRDEKPAAPAAGRPAGWGSRAGRGGRRGGAVLTTPRGGGRRSWRTRSGAASSAARRRGSRRYGVPRGAARAGTRGGGAARRSEALAGLGYCPGHLFRGGHSRARRLGAAPPAAASAPLRPRS